MVFDKVKSLIAEQLDIDENIITMDTDIVTDLNADSLDIVEMLMTIESEWDIVVADEDVANLKTIKGVVEYIEKNVK